MPGKEERRFERRLMQLDEIVRGGKRMVDGVPPGGEHRVVDSASYIDAVAINQEGTLSNRLLSSSIAPLLLKSEPRGKSSKLKSIVIFYLHTKSNLKCGGCQNVVKHKQTLLQSMPFVQLCSSPQQRHLLWQKSTLNRPFNFGR